MKFSKFLILLTVLFFVHCHIEYENLNFLDDMDELIPLEREKAKSLLGVGDDSLPYLDGKTGYSSFQNKFVIDECFQVKEPTFESESSEIQFDSSYSRSRLYSYLQLSLDVSVGNISGKFGFEEEFQEHKLTSWQFYLLKYSRNRRINYSGYFEKMLNENGKAGLEESRKGNNDSFIRFCGDQKVTRVNEGGLVIIGAKIDFESVYYRRTFEIGFSAGFAMVTLASELKSLFAKLSIKGKLSFRAKQFGGNPGELTKVLPQDKTDACAAAVDPLLEDNSKAIKECNSLVKGFDEYKADFIKQFPDRSKFYTFNFEREDLLEDFDLPSNAEGFDYNSVNLRKRRAKKFFQLNKYYFDNLDNIANDYTFKSKIPVDFSNKINNLLGVLRLNNEKLLGMQPTAVYNFKFNNCWDTPDKCTAQNFDKAYNDLDKTVFGLVDVLIEPLKTVFEVEIITNHANIGAMPESVAFRIFPIGNGKWDLLHVGGTLGHKGMTGGWELDSYSVNDFNKFWFRYKYDVTINVSPANGFNPSQKRNVNVSCNKVKCPDQTLRDITNPFYFFPQKLV